MLYIHTVYYYSRKGNPLMAKIEEILTTKFMNTYQENRYPWNWLWIELMANKVGLGRQLNDDLRKFETFKAEIWEAMAGYDEGRGLASKKWSLLLQARIGRLDFSLSIWTAFGKVVGTTAILLSIIWALSGLTVGEKSLLFVSYFFSGLVFAVFTFNIERKKNWYRYVGSHLDAIVKENDNVKQPRVNEN